MSKMCPLSGMTKPWSNGDWIKFKMYVRTELRFPSTYENVFAKRGL